MEKGNILSEIRKNIQEDKFIKIVFKKEKIEKFIKLL